MYVFSNGVIAPCFLKKSASTRMSGQSSGLWRSFSSSFHSLSVMWTLPVPPPNPPPPLKSRPSDWNVTSSTRARARALPSRSSFGGSIFSSVLTHARTSAPSIFRSVRRASLRFA